MPTINSPTPDATTTTKGKVQLAGALAGTAASPALKAATSQANAGTAGGTIYYVNLGGFKMAWGTTANTIGATSPTTYTVTWPTSFFTTIQSCTLTVGPNNTTNQQSATIAGGGLTTTTLSINVWASTTTSAEPVQFFAIGT